MKRTAILAAAVILCSTAARAQERVMTQAEYKKLMEQAMKSGTYSQEKAQSWDARLKPVSGSVMIKPSGRDEWSGVAGEVPLDPGDMVKTGSDGLAEVYLDDKGAIYLSRNTEFEVSSLDQEDAVLALAVGSLVAKIRHFLNDKFSFKVRTPSAVCAIRGTEFAVEHTRLSEESAFAVFDEGKVEVTPSGKGASGFLLEKNSEIVINPDRKRFKVVKLFRMGRHRTAIGKMRKRLSSLKNWRPRSMEKRKQLRERALKGKTIRRNLRDKGRKSRKTRSPRKTR